VMVNSSDEIIFGSKIPTALRVSLGCTRYPLGIPTDAYVQIRIIPASWSQKEERRTDLKVRWSSELWFHMVLCSRVRNFVGSHSCLCPQVFELMRVRRRAILH
jgi:hypothetical protein